MNRFAYGLAVLLIMTAPAAAQTSTTVLARTATTDAGAYHNVEVTRQHDRWLPISGGYLDFNDAKQYREFYLGAGRIFVDNPTVTVAGIGWLDQAFGPAGNGATSFVPWVLASARLTPKVTAQANYMYYAPLDDQATSRHVVEHAKVEYDVFRYWRVGAGHSAVKRGTDDMQHKPFITTTFLLGPLGEVELWYQRLPNDRAVQVRFIGVYF